MAKIIYHDIFHPDFMNAAACREDLILLSLLFFPCMYSREE